MGVIVGLQVDPEIKTIIKKEKDSILKFVSADKSSEEDKLLRSIESNEVNADVLVLGSKLKDPVRIAQRLHFIDRNISVIILCNPKDYHQMLDAIQFAPFLGEEVSCVSTRDNSIFRKRLKIAIERTQNRKNHTHALLDMNLQIPGQSSLQMQATHYVDRLLDLAPTAVVLVEKQGKVLAWNKKAEGIFSKSEREALGVSFNSFFHPFEKEIQQFVSDCLSSPHISRKETFYREQKEEQQYLEITAKGLVSDVGVSNVLLIIDNITNQVIADKQRREAEEAIRVSEERLQLALDASESVGVWDWDVVNDKVYADARFANLYSVDSDKVADGEPIASFVQGIHPEDRKRVQDVITDAMQSSGDFSSEYRLVQRDGSVRWVLARGKCKFDAKDRPLRFLGVTVDITERKQLEKQKDDFIAIASHELKTPVTSVKAFTQVLKNRFTKAGDERSAALLSKMDAQLNKLKLLIADLLDVTRLDAGKMQFQKERFDLNELISSTVEEVKYTIETHKIIEKLDKSETIYGDKDRVGQVLINMISNAVKYSPEKDKIIVSTQLTKDTVSVCVRDFGVGISKEDQKKLFERFYRVSGTKEDTYPGMGLGLYISAEIVERHGGDIWVESKKGKGSTFCFSLPVLSKD